MDKIKGSAETLSDFRKRNISSVFSSLRPKKEPKEEKNRIKKKFLGSKSIFSTLILANVEDRLFLDPSGSMESMSFEAQKEKLRSKLDKVKIEKLNSPKIVISNADNNFKKTTNAKLREEAEEDEDTEEEVEMLKPVSFIVLNVDSYILDIYQDVLYSILHQLHSCGDDNDEPEIQPESAFNYVRDAFGVNECKHLELMEKMRERSECINGADESHNRQFSQSKNYENLSAHCDLMKILLKHELESSKTPHHYWTGRFSFLASKILSLHAEFKSLDQIHVSFGKWIAFVEIHRQYPLHLRVFENILDDIVDVYKDDENSNALLPARMSTTLTFIPACFGFSGTLRNAKIEELKNRISDHLKIKDDEIVKQFWNSSNLLHETFLKFIHDLHFKHHDEENTIYKDVILKNIFDIVRRIKKIFLPKDIEQLNFDELLKKALSNGTAEHLRRNVNRRILRKSKNGENQLNELIRLIKFCENHMKEIINNFANVFENYCKFSFSAHIYSVYDSELANIIKPIVIEICSTKEGNIDNFQQNDEKIATKLFEVYREIKRFSDHGLEYFIGDFDYQMKDYSKWFTAGIDKWNKASLFNAASRINKAIEVDNLKPEIKGSKRSSSAIDTMQILYSVKAFWESLQWSDTNKEAEIAKHVSGDLCRFAIVYFDKFSEKLQKYEAMNITGVLFKVPIEMSIAVENFNFISKEIQKLINKMTIGKVEDTKTIDKVVSNMLAHLDSTINQLLETTLRMSTETIQKLMLEGAQNHKSEEDFADRLMTYIEDMLSTLNEDLPEKNFEVAKSIIWNQILQILSELIQVSLARQQPPAFFTNLRRILSILKEIFKFTQENATDAMRKRVERIDYLLECYGLNTQRLIHQYYKERYDLQLQINKQPFNPYGVLSIYCFFVGNTLKLEILNARNLIPIGPNKKCDSFIKIHLIPEKYFSTLPSYKTKVQQNTHFPLYDEIFEFELSNEQRKIEDAIIFFNIKDKYLLGSNECIAEAFLAFRDIPEYTAKDNMRQIHLTLTRLQCDELESLKALQHRGQSGDKAAKEFLAKLRSRTIITPKKLKLPVTQL